MYLDPLPEFEHKQTTILLHDYDATAVELYRWITMLMPDFFGGNTNYEADKVND